MSKKKNERKMSLRSKVALLIIGVTLLLAAVLLFVSYRIHVTTTNDFYINLVSRIGQSEASIIDVDIVEEFLSLIKTEEYQELLDEATEKDDEEIIIQFLKEENLYEDYLTINAQLDNFRRKMGVEYIYLESVQGDYSLSIFDPDESILNLGSIIETAEEFAEYTTNDPIPATVSETEYGWLCSGYESILDKNGRAIALVGVDIDMNDIVKQREEFLLKVGVYMALYVVGAAALTLFLMNHMIVRPLDMLTNAAKEFVNGESYSLSNIMDLPIKNHDEILELYEAVRKMETDIMEYIENITSITAEKERIGAELNVATQIQADMLPSIFPAFPEKSEFDIYASMNPAKEVGGDFYDFFLVDDYHLALVMADVSGKGVPAALFMVIAKTLIKNRCLMGGGPAEILGYVNEQLCEGNEAELFVTVWLAILDIRTGKGMASNAGHEYPAIRRKDGSFELIKRKHSPAVATMEGLRFREHEFELYPGDSLFVYTDGVAEATNAEEKLFGTERMLDALNKNADASPKEIIGNVDASVSEFVGDAVQFDDITMLCLKYFGEGGADA